MADTVVVMNRGKVIREGAPQDLWADPGHEFVARMLGFGPALRVVVAAGRADLGWATAETALSDRVWSSDSGAVSCTVMASSTGISQAAIC